MRKKNYLNNKDILKQIHKSKNTFNSYTDPDYAHYDIILPDVEKINILLLQKQNEIKLKDLVAKNTNVEK